MTPREPKCATIDGRECRLPAAAVARIVADDLEQTDALSFAREWIRTDAAFCAIMGPTGIGKTVAAWHLLVRERGVCATARDVSDAYTHEGSRRRRDELETRRLLVIDEIGTERDEDAASAALFELIDARQRGTLKTLLLGNLTVAAFVARYGERTIARIRESGRIVGLASDSMRVAR